MADQSVILKPGLNNVGNYQVSGIPFATGSLTIPSGSTGTPLEITFPSVTQRIQIHNNNSNYAIKVGFSANGVKNSNYWLVEEHSTNGKTADRLEMRVKTNKIYLISADSTHNATGVYILAELTGISGYDLAAVYTGSSGIG